VAPAAEPPSKYFARYAEPEALLASALGASYFAALVVPLCRESLSFLDGYQAALAQSPGRVLLVLVLNGAVGASDETHAQNQRMLADLALRFADRVVIRVQGVSTAAWLAHAEYCDLLWLDRASPGALLPQGEGVGLARKLGADLAAQLWASGQISCSQIACGDADATLPGDYFARLARGAAAPERSTALLWPFSHQPGGDSAIDSATVLYEISLRYYVLGLASAGSPYAYQSIGSSLSFDAAAYASVRGFPKRAAAEDFYLLDKLAKVGPLRHASGAPLRLRARASDRVPFGTGRRTREIAELGAGGASLELYAPELFAGLAVVLAGLNAFAESGEPCALEHAVQLRAPDLAAEIATVLQGLKVFEALASAAKQAPAGAVLKRRIHTWFDGLRTLRFIHLLRDAHLPSVPWRTALARAPFVSEPLGDGGSPEAVCARLALTEAELPVLVGPTLLSQA
jgi:hypothetical protein